MNKNILCILVVSFIATNIFSQNIPQNTSYTRIYDFLDELANDGIIEINSAIKPYSRDFIAQKLKEAQIDSNRLNSRQAAEIHFFLQDYALELDTMPEAMLRLVNKRNTSIALLQPAVLYQDEIFKARITPILGMDIIANSKGLSPSNAGELKFSSI